MKQETELLTGRELAKRLRVAPETILEWVRDGRIPVVRLSRKTLRYSAEAVLTALATTPVNGGVHRAQ